MLRRALAACVTVVVSALAAPTVAAATLTLGWDPSTGATGYVVRYGTRAAPRSLEVDAGALTTYTFTNLVANNTYCFVVYARSSAGISGASNEVCALVDPPAGSPVPRDFNLDGRYDLAWQHQGTGHISAWMMNGPTMVSGVLFTPGQVADTDWKIVGRGDLNGDGATDLVWRHQRQGLLSTWLMNGTQLVSGLILTPDRVADTDWQVVGVADANGDGKSDLYWHHRTTGMLSIWLMNGTTMVEGIVLSPDRVADTNWQVAGVGDMNADGHPDLVWQHQTTGLVSTWHMRGSRMIGSTLFTPSQVADTNWKIRSIGDVDGDGQNDLIWQNQATGMLSTWLMNGAQMRAGVLLSPSVVSDTNWRIVR